MLNVDPFLQCCCLTIRYGYMQYHNGLDYLCKNCKVPPGRSFLHLLCCFETSFYRFCVVDLLFIKAILSIKQVKRITKWIDNTKFDTKFTVQAVYSEVKPKKEFCPPHPGLFGKFKKCCHFGIEKR